MGFTHIWVTGVLQQATATDYADIGEPADDPDLLKGVAGSPYAIRDYFDVSPDYADDPAKRREEFKAMIDRIHAKGMKVLIDFVPNHVARSYGSNVKPELSFGANDNRDKFFDPKNNFYYLAGEVEIGGSGPPLRLPTVDGNGRATSPTVQAVGGGDGLFDGEKEFGRVTGNDIALADMGVTVRYVIDRLCVAAGPATQDGCTLAGNVIPPSSSASELLRAEDGSSGGVGAVVLKPLQHLLTPEQRKQLRQRLLSCSCWPEPDPPPESPSMAEIEKLYPLEVMAS
jgi:hypothetical protein